MGPSNHSASLAKGGNLNLQTKVAPNKQNQCLIDCDALCLIFVHDIIFRQKNKKTVYVRRADHRNHSGGGAAASSFGGDIALPCQVEQSTSKLEINCSQVINPENNK